ncbi:MAG: hypothetical protein MJ102_05820 [Clostridia bacterium]|nr:hypothetical protein [Clostridia bacterium]
MKNARSRNVVSLAMNLSSFVLTLISILWFFRPAGAGAGVGNMSSGGTGCFRFFTNDSNILSALISLAVVPFNIKSIISGKDEIPDLIMTLKMIGTAAVTLTMTVVLVFLGPTQGFAKMYSGVCFELHLICPLLAIISFCFFERGLFITKKRLLWVLLPTFIYGTVYLINVVFIQTWKDFYGFNIGGFWYISYFVIHIVTFLIALVLRSVHNAFDRKTSVSSAADRKGCTVSVP